MEQEINKLFISWDDISNHCKNVVKNLQQNSDIKYDCIISIGRGGMVPSRIISELLDIRDIYIYNIRSYTDDKKSGTVISESFDFDKLKDKNILIIDDCYTTGKTIDEVIKRISISNNELFFTTVTLFENIQSLNNNRRPDLFSTVYDANKDWIVFPWEIEAL